MSNAGDLGRRVTERREQLGLSVDEVAIRAGMNRSYLGSLEERPSPQLSRSALWRLAAALETTVEALSGGGLLATPGRATPSTRPALDDLDRQTCHALISEGGVGRVVFHQQRGPVALPVNFRMLDENVVLRTAPSAALLQSLGTAGVSFEVDQIDDALCEGWSVLISGEASAMSDPAERQLAQTLGVTPWAGGSRDVYVRIVPKEMTGRRIRRAE
jgi:nitroimidazol reductase NimA-like FMN-containing flavoprotein (pyridoxamine 5'-phosphate oxidase superfamily)